MSGSYLRFVRRGSMWTWQIERASGDVITHCSYCWTTREGAVANAEKSPIAQLALWGLADA